MVTKWKIDARKVLDGSKADEEIPSNSSHTFIPFCTVMCGLFLCFGSGVFNPFCKKKNLKENVFGYFQLRDQVGHELFDITYSSSLNPTTR